MSGDPILRIDEGDDERIAYSWDSVWLSDVGDGCADFVIANNDPDAEDAEPEQNRGGLKAQDTLGTAILICLFTDARRPNYIEAPDGSEDPRGWHGDSYDVDQTAGEREIGSLLWTLARAAINFDTLSSAEHFASEALQTLVDQGVVDHFEISAEPDEFLGRIYLTVKAFAPTSEGPVFAQTFSLQ